MPGYEWRTTSELKNPCYDTETKTDCPDRCGGCQLNCPKWKAYLVERDELYKKRQIAYEANAPIEENKSDIHTRSMKKQMRRERIHR